MTHIEPNAAIAVAHSVIQAVLERTLEGSDHKDRSDIADEILSDLLNGGIELRERVEEINIAEHVELVTKTPDRLGGLYINGEHLGVHIAPEATVEVDWTGTNIVHVGIQADRVTLPERTRR